MITPAADTPSALYDLGDQVRDFMLGKAYFAPMAVISERPKTTADKIAKIEAKYSGVFLAILVTEGRATKDYTAGPELEVFVDVSASEKTTTNRVGEGYRICTEVIEMAIRGLHWHCKPAIATERLLFESFRPDAADGATGLLIMTARFRTTLRFDPTPLADAAP